MSRRRAPRPAAAAFRTALRDVSPRSPLAAVQAAWGDVAGARVAAAATPVSERAGVVTVACSDPVWAEELDLLRDGIEQALREQLGEAAPRALRFRVKDDR